jgi:predicted MFS family arabinose efflux permease
MPDALRDRAFRSFWLAHSISSFGDKIVQVALPFAVLEATGSLTALGVVMAALFAPRAALVLVGGVVGDRVNRRSLLVGSDLVRMAAQAAIAFALIAGSATAELLTAAAVVYGAADAFFDPAARSALPDIVAAGQLQRANSLLSLSKSVATLVGPAVAGVVIAVSGTASAFVLDAASFAVSAVLLATIVMRPRLARLGQSALSELREGARTVLETPWIWRGIAFFAFVNVPYGAVYVLTPAVLRADGSDASAWSAVLVAMGVGALAAGALTLRVRLRAPLSVGFAAMAASAVLPFLLAHGAPLAVLCAAGAASAGSLVLTNTLWFTALQQHVPPELQARVAAWDTLGSLLFQPLGLALAGVAATAVGAETVLVVSGFMLLAGPVALVLQRPIRGVEGVFDRPTGEAAA